MDQAEIDRLLMKPTGRKRLGKYVLLGRLGHGGMGKIYLAYLPGPAGVEKLLVIKRLHSHLTGDAVLVGNFLDEARLSMVLSHPNIVHTYDVGEVSGRYFMVMEFIDGQNLGVVLRTAKRSGQYPESYVWAGMFIPVLEALHAAHNAVDARGRALDIIHRDISPQNVLITYAGVPKLVDFGIAKAAMRLNETDAGVLKGKYAYMSPEQCQSDVLDPRSDVFSAGIVLWECLAGRRLYKSDSIIKSVERIMHEAPIPPTRVNADCDPDLAKVVLKALQKRPRDRFDSAEDFRDALDEAVRKQHNYRSRIARDLMRDLFSDVMARQRKILDACLTSAEDGDADPVVDDLTGGKDSHIFPPALDLAGEVEPTTPSAQHRSPMLTQEDSVDDLPQTKDQRSPVQASLPKDASTPSDVTVATGPDSVDIAGTSSKKKNRAPLFAAVLALLLLPLCGVAIALGYDAANTEDTNTAASNLTSLDDKRTISDDPKKMNEKKKKKLVTKRKRSSADDDNRAKEQKDRRRATAERDASKGVKANDSKPNATGRARSTRRRSRGRERVKVATGKTTDSSTSPKIEKVQPKKEDESTKVAKKDDVVEETKKAERAIEKTQLPAAGALTLETIPWTKVYLGKKFLGNTPLVNVVVPSGRLVFRLVNKAEGVDHRYEAKVLPNKTFRARLGLK